MVVSSLFLKKMVTQTLQSGQRSHHLLFNYERDNFRTMTTSRKPVEVKLSTIAEKKMEYLEKANNNFFELVKRELRRFVAEYPDSVCANVHPAGKDGFRKFVAENSRTITFSGIGEETPGKHILHIHDIFF
jgi:hypothetical protein